MSFGVRTLSAAMQQGKDNGPSDDIQRPNAEGDPEPTDMPALPEVQDQQQPSGDGPVKMKKQIQQYGKEIAEEAFQMFHSLPQAG